MYLHSYLNTATRILSEYNHSSPFAGCLKEYFKQNKKYGSKDRKHISNLCYCYFRLGGLLKDIDIEEKLLIGQFLCSENENVFIDYLKPEWKENINLPLKEKLKFLQLEYVDIFPLNNDISTAIDKEMYNSSMLIQPDLFIRCRSGKTDNVISKLVAASVTFYQKTSDCIGFPNATKLDDILEIDREAVIQDLSSQQVLKPLLATVDTVKKINVWDCCAASGGKSILVKDHFPNSQLTISDIRESIIHNLQNRLKRAGIINYKSFPANVADAGKYISNPFDVIICDAPCSGSGTWSRTPEQLVSFQKEKIEHYSNLQKDIAIKAAKYLKSHGYFLYITCSVFAQENEAVVDYLTQNTSMQKISEEYIKGYDQKADTLYVALLQS